MQKVKYAILIGIVVLLLLFVGIWFYQKDKPYYSAETEAESYREREIPTVTDRKLTLYDMDYYSKENLYICKQIEKFAAEVAAGNISETVMDIDVKDMLGKLEFSPEELGVDSITYDNYGELVKRILNYKISDFMWAMLNQNPFEFYWFNKEAGVHTLEYSVSFGEDGSLILPDKITIQLAVSKDYQKDDNKYQVDPERVQDALKTKEKAMEIVDEARSLSDSEKLLYYYYTICDLTSYDHDMKESEDPEEDYGDSWQMTSVFDGNPDTKSLCEGYSKAFQFLCDQTSFEEQIYVYSVRGYANGNGHMWNVVQMEDGKNYLVDVTACDSTGVPEEQVCFMKAPDEGNWKDGYTFKPRDIITEKETIYFKGREFTYYDPMKQLWQDTILDLAEEDFQF